MNRIIDLQNISLLAADNRASEYSYNDFNTSLNESYKMALDILIKNNPNKITFSIKDAGSLLNVGEEFIRRRIKSGAIKVIYFGDKPMIHITELARISINGVE